jgi:hypothetical protein
VTLSLAYVLAALRLGMFAYLTREEYGLRSFWVDPKSLDKGKRPPERAPPERAPG